MSGRPAISATVPCVAGSRWTSAWSTRPSYSPISLRAALPLDPRHLGDLLGVALGVALVLVADQVGHADLEQPPELALGAGRVDDRRGLRRHGGDLGRLVQDLLGELGPRDHRAPPAE